MARKKKTETPLASGQTAAADGKKTKAGDKVECPQHPDHFLTVSQDPELGLIAVCNCNVRSNMWKGRVVWQKQEPLSVPAYYEGVSVAADKPDSNEGE